MPDAVEDPTYQMKSAGTRWELRTNNVADDHNSPLASLDIVVGPENVSIAIAYTAGNVFGMPPRPDVVLEITSAAGVTSRWLLNKNGLVLKATGANMRVTTGHGGAFAEGAWEYTLSK